MSGAGRSEHDPPQAAFEIVVAADEDDGIARQGELPWHLPGDLAYFRRVTTAGETTNTVIMGRKTWESIPPRFRPLPERRNVVLTRNPSFEAPGGVPVHASLEDALRDCPAEGKCFVVGGGEIYRQAIASPSCRRVLLTRVEGRFGCDTFFPPIPGDYRLVGESDRHEENGTGYRFLVYERNGRAAS